jgi:hypothetical protein
MPSKFQLDDRREIAATACDKNGIQHEVVPSGDAAYEARQAKLKEQQAVTPAEVEVPKNAK